MPSVESRHNTAHHYRPHNHRPTGQQCRSSNHRHVEKLSLVDKLFRPVVNLMSDLADGLTSLGEYLCEHVSIKNFVRTKNELKHQCRQELLDLKIQMADSESERFKLRAKKKYHHFAHRAKQESRDLWSEFKPGKS